MVRRASLARLNIRITRDQKEWLDSQISASRSLGQVVRDLLDLAMLDTDRKPHDRG